MKEYTLHKGIKTRFLNLFRRAFTFPAVERFLIKQIERNPTGPWRKLVPPDYLYKKGSCRKTSIDGIRFQLDIHNVVEHLVYFRLAPENFSPVESRIWSARVIFDIGANIGSTALYFASINQDAAIYSFEPHPATFRKTTTNVGLNAFRNIRLINAGMGDQPGPQKLYEVVDNNPGMNRIMPENDTYPFTWIEILTLDGFCRENHINTIDFIKIDVEGFEYHILVGGRDIITRSHPLIYLELYDHGLRKNGHSARELIVLLAGFGYNRFTNAYTLKPVDRDTDLTDCDFDLIIEKVPERTSPSP